MKILVAAKNKGTFLSWAKTNLNVVKLHKTDGIAYTKDDIFYYTGHDPERLRGFSADGYVVMEEISTKLLYQLQRCSKNSP